MSHESLILLLDKITIDKQNATLDHYDKNEKRKYRYYPIKSSSGDLIALDAIPWKKGFVFNLMGLLEIFNENNIKAKEV